MPDKTVRLMIKYDDRQAAIKVVLIKGEEAEACPPIAKLHKHVTSKSIYSSLSVWVLVSKRLIDNETVNRHNLCEIRC